MIPKVSIYARAIFSMVLGGKHFDIKDQSRDEQRLLDVEKAHSRVLKRININSQNASLSALHLTLSKALGHDLSNLGGRHPWLALPRYGPWQKNIDQSESIFRSMEHLPAHLCKKCIFNLLNALAAHENLCYLCHPVE